MSLQRGSQPLAEVSLTPRNQILATVGVSTLVCLIQGRLPYPLELDPHGLNLHAGSVLSTVGSAMTGGCAQESAEQEMQGSNPYCRSLVA